MDGDATSGSAVGGGSMVESEPKIKRKMKTTAQLETLESTYAVEQYPSENLRAELSIKLGLSDRQLQMWFCHRRLKDRKAKTVVNGGSPVGAPVAEPPEKEVEVKVYHHQPGVAVPRIGYSGEIPVRRYYEPPQAISELRAIAFVEAQLGEPIKEDGPILGMEFDPLPPGSFHTPIVSSRPHNPPPGRLSEVKIYEKLETSPNKDVTKRAIREYQFLPEQPTIRNDTLPSHYIGSPIYNVPIQLTSLSLVKPGTLGPLGPLGPQGSDEGLFMTPERRIIYDEERLEKKRKSEEVRIAREVEAHEKRIRKELEKQDILRRKREEQMKKDMERQERERRKEEERLLREKLREEERCQREQRREIERRERFLQKESMRVEKMKQKEELRKGREAAKLKAANDRAVARRFAKESIDLIEDEQLELMELLAQKKGFNSISSLDVQSLETLESYRDMLPEFPVKSVQLKRPFLVEPWINSEENVGNLLMVWRFLITFADILTLWPFTLDEYLQAFHDYDTRLLGEIHISLLKTIIKDIEDVARTPNISQGANQSSGTSSGGGHPQIVEGAYTWGFDIKSWKSYLNPLTWPEILRQFALSAGFGPKLKKRGIEQSLPRDENEDDDGKELISNLRNGVTAENALAIMQERGLSNSRRSRHCLTPGTVKFAAFHVLSLEGSKGITIPEVAEKIQKSGLRDLTTSKTPEASISAALSRDPKLFERTAPSTYCVRAPFRKDPEHSEAILASAREQIEVFKKGEEEEEEEKENDEDYESAPDETVDNGKKGKGDEEEEMMDDNTPGEGWVEGLTEGEYCNLTVQERLDAIVALISFVNEGNSVRVVLEERLEAANALKKQMWAEAQLDKRRIKEAQYPNPEGSHSPRADPNLLMGQVGQAHEIYNGPDNIMVQQSRSQLKSLIGHRAEEMYVYRSLPLGYDRRRNRYFQFVTSNSQNDPGSGKLFIELCDGKWRIIDTFEDFDALLGSLDIRGFRESHLHSMLQKIELSFKETIKKTFSNSPKSPNNISSDEPSSSSRPEKPKRALERYQEYEKWMWEECMNPRILSGLKYGKNMRCKLVLNICQECYNLWHFEDNHCTFCHKNYDDSLDYEKHVVLCSKELENGPGPGPTLAPVRIRLLKAQLASIEAFIPQEALETKWSNEARKLWGKNLESASKPEELLKILTTLENVIKKDFLSSNYETTKDLLCNKLEGSVCNNSILEGPVAVLPWIPETTSAVGLRLLEFDSSIFYSQEMKKVENFKALPPKYAAISNVTTAENLPRGRGGRGSRRGSRSSKSKQQQKVAKQAGPTAKTNKPTKIIFKHTLKKEETKTESATIPFESVANRDNNNISSSSDRSDYDNAPNEYEGEESRKEDFDYNIEEENCSEEEFYHMEESDDEKRSDGGDRFENMDEDSRYSSSEYSD